MLKLFFTGGTWQECGSTSYAHLYLMLSMQIDFLAIVSTLLGWNHEAGHLQHTLLRSEKVLPGYKGLKNIYNKSIQPSHIWSVPRHQIHQQVLAQDSSAMQATCEWVFAPVGLKKTRRRAAGQALVLVLGWSKTSDCTFFPWPAQSLIIPAQVAAKLRGEVQAKSAELRGDLVWKPRWSDGHCLPCPVDPAGGWWCRIHDGNPCQPGRRWKRWTSREDNVQTCKEDGIAVDGFSHMKKNTTSWWLQCGQKAWTWRKRQITSNQHIKIYQHISTYHIRQYDIMLSFAVWPTCFTFISFRMVRAPGWRPD